MYLGVVECEEVAIHEAAWSCAYHWVDLSHQAACQAEVGGVGIVGGWEWLEEASAGRMFVFHLLESLGVVDRGAPVAQDEVCSTGDTVGYAALYHPRRFSRTCCG